MAAAGHRQVTEYLGRLHAAAWQLPADRRTALVNRTRDQLHADLGDEPTADHARDALDRLGAPEDLVRAELAVAGAAQERPLPAPPLWGSREVAAVLLLAVGGLALPVVGPVVGLVLTWFSDRWTTADRLMAVVLAVLPLVLLLGVLTSAPPVAVALLVPLAGLVPAGYLALVLRHRGARGHEVAAQG